MTHFGLICPATTGHLNTMLPLGNELQQRGHQVTFMGQLDTESKVKAAGLGFRAIGEADFPLGSMADFLTQLGQLRDREALAYTIEFLVKGATMRFRDIPAVIQSAGIEALLVDQVTSDGGTIAEHVGIPFVSICSAIVLHREPCIPPYVTHWHYAPSWWGRLRNRIGYKAFDRAVQPITTVINEHRQRWNLPALASPNDRHSQLAQISQQPAELEFPRETLPSCLHFTGPYHTSIGREIPDFPYEQLTGKPIIYASLGTIQNRLIGIFQQIAEACADLDAQLVISLGGSAKPDALPSLAGAPLVVEYAPQLELLKQATLTITHGGMNTVLECLNNGVPMVAIPIANDQPGVAARVVWTGCGEALPVKQVSVTKLKKAISQVWTDAAYKENAMRLQASIQQAGGVKRAIDIVEQVIATGEPVLA
ncbi:MAG: glycosyltransferase [Phormidesmis sp.]